MRHTFTGRLWGSSPTHTAVDEEANDAWGGTGGMSDNEIVMPTMFLIGVTDTSTFAEFRNGSRQIIEGRMFENAGEVVVSMDFAELNDIKIGDIMEYRGIFALPNNMELTVTGIYFDATEEYSTGIRFASLNRRNEILTTFETFRSYPSVMSEVTVDTSFFLRSPAYLSAFEADVRKMGLSDDFVVTTDEVSFNAIVAPVEGLRSISITFLVVVLMLGAIILFLLSSMAIRERKYEIGILRAMGMKKSKVAHGLLCEMVALTMICLILGLGAGTVTAQPIANTLLQQQLEVAQDESQENPQSGLGGISYNFFDPTARQVEEAEPLSEIRLRLGVDTLIQIAGIALLLAVIASVMGIVNITKYEPIKILMERN